LRENSKGFGMNSKGDLKRIATDLCTPTIQQDSNTETTQEYTHFLQAILDECNELLVA
jgi:hypothetical protein